MRRITSIILLVTFVIVSVTGVMLMAGVKDKTSGGQRQQVSADKTGTASTTTLVKPIYTKEAHIWAGFLFIGAGALHLVLNGRAMVSYFRIGRRRPALKEARAEV